MCYKQKAPEIPPAPPPPAPTAPPKLAITGQAIETTTDLSGNLVRRKAGLSNLRIPLDKSGMNIPTV